jgi:hypothetical protein
MYVQYQDYQACPWNMELRDYREYRRKELTEQGTSLALLTEKGSYRPTNAFAEYMMRVVLLTCLFRSRLSQNCFSKHIFFPGKLSVYW